MAASFASLPVSLARRPSAECRPANASVVPCVGVGSAVGAANLQVADSVLAGGGSWSCAGMGGWPFGGRRNVRGAARGAWAGRSVRLTGERAPRGWARTPGPAGSGRRGRGGDHRRVRDVNIASPAHSSASLLIPFCGRRDAGSVGPVFRFGRAGADSGHGRRRGGGPNDDAARAQADGRQGPVDVRGHRRGPAGADPLRAAEAGRRAADADCVDAGVWGLQPDRAEGHGPAEAGRLGGIAPRQGRLRRPPRPGRRE